ncbi:tetratricopeptide repeat protein [Methanobacterium sp.]|uniref:tetratricopeptide repeat protein n=1 Tax=Methanobacterium sp. TaxID=2164 RepID=UPI003C731DDA
MAKKEAEMFHKQAMSFLGQGEIQKAIEFFNKATDFDEEYFPAWNNKGIALLELKKYKEALECFNKVLSLNSLDKMVWYNKGYTLFMLEEYGESVTAFDNFLYSYSKDDDAFYKYALYLQANGLYHLKKYDKAVEILRSLLVKDENFREAQELLNQISKETGIR